MMGDPRIGPKCDRCGVRGERLENIETFLFCFNRSACETRKLAAGPNASVTDLDVAEIELLSKRESEDAPLEKKQRETLTDEGRLRMERREAELVALANQATERIGQRPQRVHRETQASITAWADETFGPAVSCARIAARANDEMAELLTALTTDDAHPGAAEEVADVFIVLYRLAARLGVDIHAEVDRKMAVNRRRIWKVDATGHGTHVNKGYDE